MKNQNNNSAASDLNISAGSVPEVEITQMSGGGSSWLYALRDGKVLGACHRDNKDGMKILREIQAQNTE